MTDNVPDRRSRTSHYSHYESSGSAKRWYLLRITVGTAFLLIGLMRLRDSAELATTLETLRVFPHWMVSWIAWCLPAVEAIAGGLLLAGIQSRVITGWLILITGGMFAAVSLALARGSTIEWGAYAYLGGRLTGGLMLVTYAVLTFFSFLMILSPVPRASRNRSRARFRMPRFFIPQNRR